MILYDIRCPIDDLLTETEDVPLFYKGGTPQDIAVGKHLHASVDQTFECASGHRWRLEGALLLSREV